MGLRELCPLSGAPLFCEFYYRNDKALDTTFAEIPDLNRKGIDTRNAQHDLIWYVSTPSLKISYENGAWNQTQMILY